MCTSFYAPQASPNFQALFQDLPDLTPPRKKMSYSSFTGQSPSGADFGFPRLAEGSPDRQRLGFEFLQRPSSASNMMSSPPNFISPRGALGMPPLPIFQPSPMRGSQTSTYLSPDSKEKRRLSEISEFQRFSMSPGYQGQLSNGSRGFSALALGLGDGNSCLTSAFADILDGHSRVSPRHFSIKTESKTDKRASEGSFWKDDAIPVDLNNASNSPMLLKQELSLTHGLVQTGNMKSGRRKSLDFSDVHLSPIKIQQDARPYPTSPGLPPFHSIEGPGDLLPIHPLQNRSRGVSPNKSLQSAKGSQIHPQIGLDTSTQSPMGVKLGLIRREDLIDSPAVKEATDAAVAAAMRANSEVCNQSNSVSSLKRPQRAAAAGVAAAAAAAASGPLKGRRASAYHAPSGQLTNKDNNNALFMQASIPGMLSGTQTKCKCKKSKCLKLYCECFKARGYCGDDCSCEGCSNKPGCDDDIENAREIILTRNPQAFAEKIAETVVPSQDGLLTSGAQHMRGCNCKKSRCQKKYCECFQAGVPCGEHCKCNGCANTSQNHNSMCLQASSIVGLKQHYPVPISIQQTFWQSLGTDANDSKNMQKLLKYVQQQQKTNKHGTQNLIPVQWSDVMNDEAASETNLTTIAGAIEGLTPVAPGNLQIHTDKDA